MKRIKRPSVGFLAYFLAKHLKCNDLPYLIITLLTEATGISGKNRRSAPPENVE